MGEAQILRPAAVPLQIYNPGFVAHANWFKLLISDRDTLLILLLLCQLSLGNKNLSAVRIELTLRERNRVLSAAPLPLGHTLPFFLSQNPRSMTPEARGPTGWLEQRTVQIFQRRQPRWNRLIVITNVVGNADLSAAWASTC